MKRIPMLYILASTLHGGWGYTPPGMLPIESRSIGVIFEKYPEMEKIRATNASRAGHGMSKGAVQAIIDDIGATNSTVKMEAAAAVQETLEIEPLAPLVTNAQKERSYVRFFKTKLDPIISRISGQISAFRNMISKRKDLIVYNTVPKLGPSMLLRCIRGSKLRVNLVEGTDVEAVKFYFGEDKIRPDVGTGYTWSDGFNMHEEQLNKAYVTARTTCKSGADLAQSARLSTINAVGVDVGQINEVSLHYGSVDMVKHESAFKGSVVFVPAASTARVNLGWKYWDPREAMVNEAVGKVVTYIDVCSKMVNLLQMATVESYLLCCNTILVTAIGRDKLIKKLSGVTDRMVGCNLTLALEPVRLARKVGENLGGMTKQFFNRLYEQLKLPHEPKIDALIRLGGTVGETTIAAVKYLLRGYMPGDAWDMFVDRGVSKDASLQAMGPQHSVIMEDCALTMANLLCMSMDLHTRESLHRAAALSRMVAARAMLHSRNLATLLYY
jgi:hypothetical protein